MVMEWKDGIVVRTASVPQPDLDEFDCNFDGMISIEEQEVEQDAAEGVIDGGEEE